MQKSKCFEEIPSYTQHLTFDAAERIFKRNGQNLDFQMKQTLKMTDSDGRYTNLGLLLSDQCKWLTMVAVFQGSEPDIMCNRREFSGSLLQQFNDSYVYLERYNPIQATFQKLLRIDTRDYSEMELWNALIELFAHRSYMFSANALIRVYSDRTEFAAIGELMLSTSTCRNPNLKKVLYQLKFIEKNEMDSRRAVKTCGCLSSKFVIQNTKNAFRIILPNSNVK